MELVTSSHVMDLMFVFGVVGMIAGSVNAIFSHDLRRMVAFSSVAQIGYIYAGLGLGTNIGFVAAIYHMLMQALSLIHIEGQEGDPAEGAVGEEALCLLEAEGVELEEQARAHHLAAAEAAAGA